MKPSCSPHRTGSEHVLFDLGKSISKFVLVSGQSGPDQMTQEGQYTDLLGHDLDNLVCIYPGAARRAKSFGIARLYLHHVATY